jgi:hypothetical protein
MATAERTELADLLATLSLDPQNCRGADLDFG